ncbi:MAG: uroporphyrinogen decarboxylase [unclassified Hahellaceae]|nr:uroporphyrinogen decarboxylase [Hahellaceae bacterium]|tara:strand:- start:17598 stop:18659 length:1062 start_codon:yes stop_codon:yes gene_type:complete
MTHLENDIFLRALLRQPVERTPVWVMRQAGRYLPEYRASRENAGSFMDLCRNADLACEVTLQPLARFDLDAAILFSDILTIPDAMGLGLYFETGEGPKFKHTIRSRADVDALPVVSSGDLDYVMSAVRTIRGALAGRVPLIGFSGSPWTLATYMVEGGSSKDFGTIKRMMFSEPDVLHALLEKLADSVISYLNGQIDAGAQAVQIFDTWGGILSPTDYAAFSLQYMKRIVAGLKRENEGRQIPVILFTKNAQFNLEKMAESGADALGVDWTVDLNKARELVQDKVALQGNLDPSVLLGSKATIRSRVAAVLESYGQGPGHVFNLGHGITPAVDPDHLKVMVDTVHELSPAYHK